MFWNSKKAVLRKAIESARIALASADLATIGRAYEELRLAQYQADADDAETHAVLEELEHYRSDVAARHFVGQARPCARCGGGEIAVSEAFRFTKLDVARGARLKLQMRPESPELRMWVCRACGATELVVDDMADLDAPIFLATGLEVAEHDAVGHGPGVARRRSRVMENEPLRRCRDEVLEDQQPIGL